MPNTLTCKSSNDKTIETVMSHYWPVPNRFRKRTLVTSKSSISFAVPLNGYVYSVSSFPLLDNDSDERGSPMRVNFLNWQKTPEV